MSFPPTLERPLRWLAFERVVRCYGPNCPGRLYVASHEIYGAGESSLAVGADFTGTAKRDG